MTSPFHPLLFAWDAWALTVLVIVAQPLHAFLRLHGRLGRSGPRPAQFGAYLEGMALQWALVAALAGVAWHHHLTFRDFGLHGDVSGRAWALTAGLLVLGAAMALAQYLQLRKLTPRERREKLGPVWFFIPATTQDQWAWTALSLTAGICEELLYRGWILNLAIAATGSRTGGLLLASALFGLAHAYQGLKGIAQTGLAGFGLSALYLGTGSLIPGQLVHAAVDLSGGLLASRLVEEGSGEAAIVEA